MFVCFANIINYILLKIHVSLIVIVFPCVMLCLLCCQESCLGLFRSLARLSPDLVWLHLRTLWNPEHELLPPHPSCPVIRVSWKQYCHPLLSRHFFSPCYEEKGSSAINNIHKFALCPDGDQRLDPILRYIICSFVVCSR